MIEERGVEIDHTTIYYSLEMNKNSNKYFPKKENI